MTERKLKLKSGYEMPVLGLGTWKLTGKDCEKTVAQALEMGYIHIDTAEMYENEQEVGEGIKGADRSKIFITSKVAKSHLKKNDVIEACQRSLDKLGTDYLDLYLVHWPNDDIPIEETMQAMEELVDKKMIRSCGLSNFDVSRIKKAQEAAQIPICNLQIEFHPFTNRHELPQYCKEQGIAITAYSPLARGEVFEDETLKEIAEKHSKTPSQVSLKWLIQNGHIVIPKASSEKHLRENMELDWELSCEDMKKIDNIKKDERLIDKKYT
ncbi:MAG: aldo/keto reductase [Sedimentisphaeraceae bacterium JB056]